MSSMIEYSESFLKEAKQLSKKFKLLKSDLKQADEEIQTKNDSIYYLKKESKIHQFQLGKVADLE